MSKGWNLLTYAKNHFRGRNMKWAVLGIVSFSIFVWATLSFFQKIYTKNQIQRTEYLLNECCLGIDALNVDVSQIARPENENEPPSVLITPISYLQRIPNDPFGNKNDTFFYITSPRPRSYYLFASRGPDRDLDFEKYSLIENFYPTTEKERTLRSWDTGIYESEINLFHEWLPPQFTLPPYKLKILPHEIGAEFNEAGTWKQREMLIELLDSYDISIYDPTNGLRSDGDIVKWEYDKKMTNPQKKNSEMDPLT